MSACTYRLSSTVKRSRYGSFFVLRGDRSFERVIYTNADNVAVFKIGANHLYIFYERTVLTASVPMNN